MDFNIPNVLWFLAAGACGLFAYFAARLYVAFYDKREAEVYCSIYGHAWRNVYGDEINHLGCRAVCKRCDARSMSLR